VSHRSESPTGDGGPAQSEPITLFPGPARKVLLAIGFVCVALGAIGTVLPLLPTTPFLLLAAACFARSSPRFYRWLLTRPGVGPIIREWRATRTIPLYAKLWATSLIVVIGASSVVFFVDNRWAQLVTSAGLLAVIVWLLRQPTRAGGDQHAGARRRR
jgi:uncharacterized membrane protein YbaN (DUF454 family)